MGSETIIALDLGKFKSAACVTDARTRAHRFAAVDTTPAAPAHLDQPAARRTSAVQRMRRSAARVNEAADPQ